MKVTPSMKNLTWLNRQFHNGTIVRTKWDNGRCIFIMNKFVNDEDRNCPCALAYCGINADNEFMENITFGTYNNEVEVASETDKELLWKHICKNGMANKYAQYFGKEVENTIDLKYMSNYDLKELIKSATEELASRL